MHCTNDIIKIKKNFLTYNSYNSCLDNIEIKGNVTLPVVAVAASKVDVVDVVVNFVADDVIGNDV
jgi:hypothetical protein